MIMRRKIAAAVTALVMTTLALLGARSAGATAGTVTATLDPFCSHYGFDVTNGTAVQHTVTMTLDGTAGAPVPIEPGATAFLALPGSTRGDNVKIVDADGTVLVDTVLTDCTLVVNRSVTIQRGTGYTLTGLVEAARMQPDPQHGTVVAVANGTELRYTPQPCFLGTDRFGYDDSIGDTQGVVTVHVVGTPCSTARGGGGSAPPSGPVLADTGPHAGRDALVGLALVVVGGLFVVLARPRSARMRACADR